ncbi:ATP-binding protein [Mycobacterium sp. M26]|uniref:AAA family ATPase n=1 Tax=Mycobacterium sp. M26 TaxID=1762962 RepID=UPI001E3D9C75|nr:ATP-binding protein [Mycobacterium sp. M26]
MFTSETSPPALLAGESRTVQRAVEVLGQILTGSVNSRTTVDGFLYAHLGSYGTDLVCESQKLSPLGLVTAGLALAAVMDQHHPAIGPGEDDEPPTWGSVEIGGTRLAPPQNLSAYFEADQLAPVPVVVQITDETFASSRIQVYARPGEREHATEVLAALMADARGAKNLYRGRALIATANNGLRLELTELPDVTRDSVIVPDAVWDEIDLSVAAVTVHRELMEQLGLGVRRGVLLAGPPGVGKTVVSQVIARELLGEFTVIIVDARAGQYVLSEVFKEARGFGPTVVILEDIDLIVENRHAGGASATLSEFLAAMDADPMAPILTMASTNDVSTLDVAAVRAARFDSIIEVGHPSTAAASQILSRYLRGVPGAEDVDARAVAAQFPADMSGADIREVVRRSVLSGRGTVCTEDLVATVRSGRFKPVVPVGTYL